MGSDGSGGRHAKNLDWQGGTAYRPSGAKASVSLREALDLLPTPTSSDHRSSGSALYPKTATHSPGTTLTDATVRLPDQWGKYADAIANWEHLTRPAPEPTIDGRLSPLFVEWMQGIPEGWVSGLTERRTQSLKILGNGVVPQQAAAAFTELASRASTATGVR